jgi:RNA polymerase sigma-70 factor (ECF subfamily)
MTIIDRLCAAGVLKKRIADRRGRLYRVACAWCGDVHLASDLVQETLARAMGKCQDVRDPTRLDSWLYSILNNCWREHLRRRRPEEDVCDQALAGTDCPERATVSTDLVEKTFRLMARLPDGQRQVLALVALEELNYREVADTLDIPIGTVMSRLSRARQVLASGLSEAQGRPAVQRPALWRVK